MPIAKPFYQLPEQMPLIVEVDADASMAGPLSAEEVRQRSEAARAAFLVLKGTQTVPGWYSEFENLLAGGWNWRVAAYIAWASSPKGTRLPQTQDELARQHLGLTSDRVISQWRRKNPVIDQMVAVLQAAPLWEQRADHFAALNDGASKAGIDYKFFPHLKLAFEMRGEYVPTSKQVIALKGKAGEDVTDLDDLELDEMGGALDGGPKTEDGATPSDDDGESRGGETPPLPGDVEADDAGEQ